MKLQTTTFYALLGCLGASALVGLAGCEDAAAKQRDNVQASLNKINRELQVAMASAGGDAGTMRLNQVITQLQGVTGGEAGQQASKALLSATAYRELADVHVSGIESIEARHRDVRADVRGKLSAALQMNSIAAGLTKVDGQTEQEALQRELQAAKASANELSQKFMQLGEPIAKQTSANEAQVKEAERLRVEVGNLLRRAQELGHADGFDTYKQAASIGRQADEIELQVAQSEIELDYQLNPDHKDVATQVNQLQGLIVAIEAAQAHLTEFTAASSGDVEATRAEITRLTNEINTSLDALSKERTEKLDTEYAEAAAALEKAITQADAAARGDAQTAKLLSIRAHEALGRLHWFQARALADQKTTLEQLVNGAKELGVNGKYAQQLGEVSMTYDQAMQKAKEQYALASEQLGGVQGRGDQETIARYQQNIDSVIAALEGKVAPPPEVEAAPAANGTDSAATPAASELGPGFDSPEAVVEFAKSLEQSTKSVAEMQQEVLDATVTESAQGKKVRQFTLDMVPDFNALFEALTAKFGREAAMEGLKTSGMEIFPDLSAATIKQIDDAHASVTFPRATGQSKTEWLVKVNDRWYFDGDKLDMEDQQQLAAIDMIGPLMKDACQKTAAQVQADAYKTPAEALQALQQAVMAGAMEQAMKAGQAGRPRSN